MGYIKVKKGMENEEIREMERTHIAKFIKQGVKEGRFDLSNLVIDEIQLSKAQIPGAWFTSVKCQALTLEGATLTAADFSEAQIPNARFRGAILVEADLAGAWLVEADFTDAVMDRADLDGANLTGATITEEQLESANWKEITVGSGKRVRGGNESLAI